jgi:hypothetical protein
VTNIARSGICATVALQSLRLCGPFMHRAADSIATWFEMLIIISAPIVTATMGIHIAFNTFMNSFSQRFVEGYAIALSPELGES